MRIALIQSPREDFYTTPQRHYPLGLLSLAGAIKDLPVETRLLDLLNTGGRRTLPLPDNFQPAARYFRQDHGPLSSFYQYYRFGLSDKEMEKLFSEEKFDLYALSGNFYTYSRGVLNCAGIIRKIHPKAVIIAGGQAVNRHHPLLNGNKIFDHVITGEGEFAFRSLVEDYLSGKTPHREIRGEIPKDLPPFRQDLDMIRPGDYRIGGKPAIMVETSRGCPMGCDFCCVANTFGKMQKRRPVEDILDLMRDAHARGIRAFDIEDDNFTLRRDHCRKLLTAVVHEFPDGVDLYAMNGISAAHLDEPLVALMKKAGFRLLNLSVATVSRELLDAVHRPVDTGQIHRACGWCKEHKLPAMVHYIAGMPGQTLEEMLATLRFISELPAVPGISPFYYIPGMKTRVPCVPEIPEDARLTRFFPATEKWDELDLITLFRLTRWVAYVKKVLKASQRDEIAFSQISAVFPDDTVLSSLVKNGCLTGMGPQKKPFRYETSSGVMALFEAIFRDSLIRI